MFYYILSTVILCVFSAIAFNIWQFDISSINVFRFLAGYLIFCIGIDLSNKAENLNKKDK